MPEQIIWKGRPSQLQNLGAYILCVVFSWLVSQYLLPFGYTLKPQAPNLK
jgi:hypothetical protein